MVAQTDLLLGDGRTLHAYDALADGVDVRLAVFWHHGTPNLGAPPEPLLPAAADRGIRWVSYDRPGYGGSTPHPGRDVASAAADVASLADALGIEQFAVMGHSGGAAHALACAALLPERVLAAVCGSGLAPYHAEGLDWFAGMGSPARRSCAPPPGDARRWRTTWRRPSMTRSCSPQPIMPPSRAHGPGC
jgi:pimeloyl-ACP methyl ester carboxylesterase